MLSLLVRNTINNMYRPGVLMTSKGYQLTVRELVDLQFETKE